MTLSRRSIFLGAAAMLASPIAHAFPVSLEAPLPPVDLEVWSDWETDCRSVRAYRRFIHKDTREPRVISYESFTRVREHFVQTEEEAKSRLTRAMNNATRTLFSDGYLVRPPGTAILRGFGSAAA